MFGNLTYSKKSWLTLGVFLFVMVLAYKVSFHRTFDLKAEIREKEQKLNSLKEKEKELPFIKAKMALIEESYVNDSVSVREKLTAYISDYAENTGSLVTEIPKYSKYKKSNLNVQTNIFTIKGNFNDLVVLIKELESKFKVSAKIMSARFFSIKDMQTKRKNLYLTLVTQSFNEVELKNNANEE